MSTRTSTTAIRTHRCRIVVLHHRLRRSDEDSDVFSACSSGAAEVKVQLEAATRAYQDQLLAQMETELQEVQRAQHRIGELQRSSEPRRGAASRRRPNVECLLRRDPP